MLTKARLKGGRRVFGLQARPGRCGEVKQNRGAP